jgi:hypothetical protein
VITLEDFVAEARSLFQCLSKILATTPYGLQTEECCQERKIFLKEALRALYIKGDRRSYRYTNAGRKRSTTAQPTTWQLDDGGDDDNAAARLNIYDILQGLWKFPYCTHRWPKTLKPSSTNVHLPASHAQSSHTIIQEVNNA